MANFSQDYITHVIRPFFTEALKRKRLELSNINLVEFSDKKFSVPTFSRLLNHGIASATMRVYLHQTLKLPKESEWRNRNTLAGAIKEKLEKNSWVSYRFDSKRHVYISSWIFKNNEHELEVSKLASKGDVLKGRFEISDHLKISGVLSDGTIELHYQTFLHPDLNLPDSNTRNAEEIKQKVAELNALIFSVIFRHGHEIYSTIEILILKGIGKPQNHLTDLVYTKTNQRVRYNYKNQLDPENLEFLAYNFLTHYSPRSRIPLVVKEPHNFKTLSYKHQIRIACPVRSIQNEEEFMRIKKYAGKIYTLLQSEFLFRKENIHFELMEYESIHTIKMPVTYIVEKNKSINYTYFIALVPKTTEKSQGVFAEIFYRIGRKYPVLIIYEDETSLSYVLTNLKESQHISNVKYIKANLEDVADRLSREPDLLFSLFVQ